MGSHADGGGVRRFVLLPIAVIPHAVRPPCPPRPFPVHRSKTVAHHLLPCWSSLPLLSLEAMRSLYRAIKACLRPGHGTALVAAKSYYFGVGGGTAAFAQLVRQDGVFSCEQLAVIDDGLSNKREILRLAPLRA